MTNFLPTRQHTARLRQRNMLSVENFSALATAYPRLRLKNLLPGINFSAHKTSYPPAQAEKHLFNLFSTTNSGKNNSLCSPPPYRASPPAALCLGSLCQRQEPPLIFRRFRFCRHFHQPSPVIVCECETALCTFARINISKPYVCLIAAHNASVRTDKVYA